MRHLQTSKYVPTTFCYQDKEAKIIQHCPIAPGIECCLKFTNGKSDCGPRAYCDADQESAYQIIIIIGIVAVVGVLLFCLVDRFYIQPRKAEEKARDEVEFSNIKKQKEATAAFDGGNGG